MHIIGYMAQYNALPRSDLEALSKVSPPTFFGVEQSIDMLQWIWENFSAVAGDHPSFECWRKYCFKPSLHFKFTADQLSRSVATQQKYMLHEILLAGWGCPIGELFDLEKLSKHCKKAGRYSFFVTSEPCNVS